MTQVDGELSLLIQWRWDELWSEEILLDCDEDQDGSLDSLETQLAYRDYFQGIKRYGYFTQISLDGTAVPVEVQDFCATVRDDSFVQYQFRVPLGRKAVSPTAPAKLWVLFKDESIYTAFDEEVGIADSLAERYADVVTTKSGFYGVEISFSYAGGP